MSKSNPIANMRSNRVERFASPHLLISAIAFYGAEYGVDAALSMREHLIPWMNSDEQFTIRIGEFSIHGGISGPSIRPVDINEKSGRINANALIAWRPSVLIRFNGERLYSIKCDNANEVKRIAHSIESAIRNDSAFALNPISAINRAIQSIHATLYDSDEAPESKAMAPRGINSRSAWNRM